MPVYNVGRFIEDSVNSVLKQSTKEGPLEFIIVDDGSTDECPQIIDNLIGNYNGDIECHVVHKVNEGVGKARNTALDMATGGWIMFIDSDDKLEDDAIAIFRKYMIKTPNADYFQASAYDIAVDEGIEARPEHYTMDRFLDEYKGIDALHFLYVAKQGPHVTPWAKLYKKSIIGGRRFVGRLKSSNDFEFNMRVWKNVRHAVCIKEYVYTRNRRAGSIICGGTKCEQMFRDEATILKQCIKWFNSIDFTKVTRIELDNFRYILCRYMTHAAWVYKTRVGEGLSFIPFPNEIQVGLEKIFEVLKVPKIKEWYENLAADPLKKTKKIIDYQKTLRDKEVFSEK